MFLYFFVKYDWMAYIGKNNINLKYINSSIQSWEMGTVF